MNFEHFRFLMEHTFVGGADDGTPAVKYTAVNADTLHPLVLAYIGDAYFTLFVRTKLLSYEQNKVRLLHNYDARIVSAVMQAAAYKELASMLTEQEISVVKRGRNAKSTVPKSATVQEYRYSTGFEALLGYLYLKQNYERLVKIAEQAFAIISREMTKSDKDSGDQK